MTEQGMANRNNLGAAAAVKIRIGRWLSAWLGKQRHRRGLGREKGGRARREEAR